MTQPSGEMLTGANGQEIELVEIGGRRVEVDVEIAPLVRALNGAGFETAASCSGHGHRPGSIILRDGRWLIIAKDREEAQKIERLFPIDINGNTLPSVTEEMVRSVSDAVSNLRCHDTSGRMLGDVLRGSEARAIARAAIEALLEGK